MNTVSPQLQIITYDDAYQFAEASQGHHPRAASGMWRFVSYIGGHEEAFEEPFCITKQRAFGYEVVTLASDEALAARESSFLKRPSMQLLLDLAGFEPPAQP